MSKFDISIKVNSKKGEKKCHMEVDPDLHKFIKTEVTRIEVANPQADISFRELANKLLCSAIQEYIVAKKLGTKIDDRTY